MVNDGMSSNALSKLDGKLKALREKENQAMVSQEVYERSLDLLCELCERGDMSESDAKALVFFATIDIELAKSQLMDAYASGTARSKSDKLQMFNNLVVQPLTKTTVIDESTGQMLMRDFDGAWRESGIRPSVSQVSLAVTLLFSNQLFPMCDDVTVKAATLLLERVTSSEKTDAIQFDDCVMLKSGELIDLASAQNGERPKFIIPCDVRDASAKPVREVDELIDHIAGHDEDTAKYLMDLCAMTLVSDETIKASLSKIVMLYGPTAENGKSTFIKLVERSLHNPSLITTVPLHQFKGFNLSMLSGKMLVIDPDGSGQHVDAEAANNIKKIVTCDKLKIDRKFKDSWSEVANVQLIMASNGLPKSEDKSHGWERRIAWFPIEEKLVKRDKWFERVQSAEASAYMLRLLVEHAQTILRDRRVAPTPERVKQLNYEYSNSNNNVRRWFMERDVAKDIHLHTLGEVRKDYEDWCEENAETPLGRNTFSQQLETMSPTLKRKLVALSDKLMASCTDALAVAKLKASGKPNARLWIDSSLMESEAE